MTITPLTEAYFLMLVHLIFRCKVELGFQERSIKFLPRIAQSAFFNFSSRNSFQKLFQELFKKNPWFVFSKNISLWISLKLFQKYLQYFFLNSLHKIPLRTLSTNLTRFLPKMYPKITQGNLLANPLRGFVQEYLQRWHYKLLGEIFQQLLWGYFLKCVPGILNNIWEKFLFSNLYPTTMLTNGFGRMPIENSGSISWKTEEGCLQKIWKSIPEKLSLILNESKSLVTVSQQNFF